MRVIVVSIDPDELPTPRPGSTRRSASAATPARARSSSLRAYGDAGARTRRASSRVCCCPTPPSSSGGRDRRPRVAVRRPPLGRIAQRRITDAATKPDPSGARSPRSASSYAPGDTDFAWTRLTLWRAQLAAVLDQPPYEPVTGVRVRGAVDSPSTALLAAWLRLAARRARRLRATRRWTRARTASTACASSARRGAIVLVRDVARHRHADASPASPMHDLALPRRNLRDCLAEELRRLDPDDLYGRVITERLWRCSATARRRRRRMA